MGLVYLLLSILAESSGKTIDKLNFKKTRISARQMNFFIFLVMALMIGAFVWATHQPLPRFTPTMLLLAVLIGLFSFGSNVFDVLSLKVNDLSLREPLCDFQPIFAGLTGYALFPGERKPGVLLAFLLGAMIVYWGSHRRKLRNVQRKGMAYLLLGICFESMMPSLYKLSLDHLSPSYIALLRVASVLLLSGLFFRPKTMKMSPLRFRYNVGAGLAYGVGAVVSIAAIQQLGVVLTMLLMLLGPFLRYFSSYFILKEHVRMGEMVSSVLLVAVVAVPLL